MNLHRRSFAGPVWTAVAVLATACGAAKTSTSTPPPAGFGQLALQLVDAPPDKASDVKELWVTITRVTAHTTSGGWSTVYTPDKPLALDLLKLQGSTFDLGSVNLPKGTVTQVRLYVSPDAGANYVVLGSDPKPVALKVPSGTQSGIKIHGPWDIQECAQTSVTLDFDGKKSIWYHATGQGDEWVLRPVIRVKKSDVVQVGCGGEVGGSAGPRSCTLTADCKDGEQCIEGTCASGEGSPCVEARECFSGLCGPDHVCGPGGAGTVCHDDGDCIGGTGSCSTTTLTCSPGAGNAPCLIDADCESRVCETDGCAPAPTAGPEGSPCQRPAECISGSCSSEGVCDPSGQGYPCGPEQSCAAGLACNAEAKCEATRPL